MHRKIILIREYANTLMRWTHWSQHDLIVQGKRPFVNGLKIWQILKPIATCHQGQRTEKIQSVTVFSEEQPGTKVVELTQDKWPLRHFYFFLSKDWKLFKIELLKAGNSVLEICFGYIWQGYSSRGACWGGFCKKLLEAPPVSTPERAVPNDLHPME